MTKRPPASAFALTILLFVARGFAQTPATLVVDSQSHQLHSSFVAPLPGDCASSGCDLEMFDIQHGVLKARNRLWATEDGGAHWIERNLPDVRKKFDKQIEVHFTDAQSGWVISGWEQLFRTLDGGVHWRPISKPALDGEIRTAWMFKGTETALLAGGAYRSIPNPDGPSHAVRRKEQGGWDVLHPVIFETRDGGATWRRHNLADCSYTIRSLEFIDHDHGYAVGDGCLYYTESGGETWNVARFPEGTKRVSRFPHDADMPLATFVNRTEGWIAFREPRRRVLYHTTDGGKNWSEAGSADGWYFDELTFPSPALGFGIIKASELYMTTDAGKTWTKVQSSQWIRQICFLNARSGWALSDFSMYSLSYETDTPIREPVSQP